MTEIIIRRKQYESGFELRTNFLSRDVFVSSHELLQWFVLLEKLRYNMLTENNETSPLDLFGEAAREIYAKRYISLVHMAG